MATSTKDDDHKKILASELAQYRPRRTQRYAAVNVLLIFWEDDDIGCAGEMTELTQMFRESFNYTVWPYKIPSQDPECSLNFCVAQFVKSFGGEENLIIVYYSGHGGPKIATRSPCTWAAKISDGPSLDWSLIQPQLFLASCDVVIFLDCCFAGQAARGRIPRSVEFLAATDKDQFTLIGSGKWPSFTKVLIREMKEMIIRDGLVTIPALQRCMVEEKAGLKRQPFYVCLTGDASVGTIKLTKQGEVAVKTGSPEATASLSSLYLRLSLFDTLDLTTSTNILRWLTKDSPSSIEDIQLVDRVLSHAKEADDLGIDLLNEDSQSGGKLLPFLSEESRKEARRLLSDFRNALTGGTSANLIGFDINRILNNLKTTSYSLVTFVAESLTALDRNSLKNLRPHDSAGTNELKSRVAMRLTLIKDSLPDNQIRVDFDDVAQAGQRLRLGKRSGDPVIVEYFYYDDTDKSAFARSSQQVARTSALLAEPKSPAFRCLQGLGFSHEILSGPRFGFIYALPGHLAGLHFSLLSDLIVQVRAVPLDIRVRTAYSLCNAVLHLHSIGWYHKNIRSDNVLIFAKSGCEVDISVDWDFANPFLIGFDCSRPSEAETRGTIDFTIKNNMYRHPERWGRSARFEKYHDLYSLGILLTELGCWRTLPSMDSKRSGFEYVRDPEALRGILLGGVLDKLAHAAGTRYSEAVRVCLAKADWTVYEDWQSQRLVREKVLEPLCRCLGEM